ncbi:hypothetical protein AvCA_16740 [Azotobacter vinelandii CA]|uniref:SRPBCC family protein n=2 Tax=Azotobacter vinelandii TaxID=354 RepID=C1DSD2_AZOVD|nr:SRPBCC family protein [Azotobacter vinelandii]ACO77887.1 conserved hypothetical protein [Azotobacter vinelandii DJ]AGK16954.1 hypothetical protein AvCA_16740 [Azotobacter vinelandii CA]AGK20051.1 hypothetical protein AvCA6_16740 [Azotobacter vinelandii CA6]WKN23624.1 SRPBCC family protein [Azotobacter vinelandii]SFY27042.1 Polyketide cyclase / dehydrase and lipid transport [Azotobacter vinelandii]
MIEVSVSVNIARPAEEVWSILGGFDFLPRWVGAIASSRLEDGGRLRRLETVDGEIVVERLLEFSESERQYSYALLESPFPVSEYVGQVAVHDEGAGKSRAVWSSRFRCQGVDALDIAADFEGFYHAGLERLKALVEGQ